MIEVSPTRRGGVRSVGGLSGLVSIHLMFNMFVGVSARFIGLADCQPER